MASLKTPEIAQFGPVIDGVMPQLRNHREDTERARSVATESISAIKAAGLMRLLVPAPNGGFEAPLRSQVCACMETARACPATSWVMMVCGAHSWVSAGFSDACREEVFAAGPDIMIAGTLASQGQFRPEEGGWRVSGRWQYCSGVDHSPWLLIGAARADGVSGPQSLHVIVPRSDVEVDDTWYTLGMHGSGSKDILLHDVFVPEHRAMPTGKLFTGHSPHAAAQQSGHYFVPVLCSLGTQLAGSILGMAKEMLELFVERTRVRPDIYSGEGAGAKARSAGIQRRVAEATGEIVCAESLLDLNCRAFDQVAQERTPPDMPTQARIRWQATYATELCRRAADRLFVGAGAHAAYDGEALQQYYRDIMMATRHAIVDVDSSAELEGSLTLGVDAAG